MEPRESSDLTKMVSEAERKLEEIKQAQFFGGDALILKRYEYEMVIPGSDTIDRCWKFVMTPTDETKTMPIDVGVKPADATTTAFAKIERVPRTDGKFEYLVMFLATFLTPIQKTDFYITYSGDATFAVTVLA